MKRLQVLFEETEYRRLVRLAKRQGMTLAEWVRQTLRFAYPQEPLGDRDKKLAAVRTAAIHEYPTADIDQMLAEIASGYGSTEEH
jgi:hypothetical protein